MNGKHDNSRVFGTRHLLLCVLCLAATMAGSMFVIGMLSDRDMGGNPVAYFLSNDPFWGYGMVFIACIVWHAWSIVTGATEPSPVEVRSDKSSF